MLFAEVDLPFWSYCALFFIVFVAQIYGAFASGDGLIIQPALIALGVPAPVAMANDTAGSAFGGLTAGLVYHKNKLMPYRMIAWWLPGILIGPVMGALLLASLPVQLLEIIILTAVILGACYFLFGRKQSNTSISCDLATKPNKGLSLLSGFVVGFLTGFGIGGVGVVTRILLMTCRLDVKRAIAASQLVGTIPIIPAVVTYLVVGLVSPILLGVLIIAFVTGAYCGSHLVLRLNSQLLERVFMISTIFVSVYIMTVKFIL